MNRRGFLAGIVGIPIIKEVSEEIPSFNGILLKDYSVSITTPNSPLVDIICKSIDRNRETLIVVIWKVLFLAKINSQKKI